LKVFGAPTLWLKASRKSTVPIVKMATIITLELLLLVVARAWYFGYFGDHVRASPSAASSPLVVHRGLHPRTSQGTGYGNSAVIGHKEPMMASLLIIIVEKEI